MNVRASAAVLGKLLAPSEAGELSSADSLKAAGLSSSAQPLRRAVEPAARKREAASRRTSPLATHLTSALPDQRRRFSRWEPQAHSRTSDLPYTGPPAADFSVERPVLDDLRASSKLVHLADKAHVKLRPFPGLLCRRAGGRTFITLELLQPRGLRPWWHYRGAWAVHRSHGDRRHWLRWCRGWRSRLAGAVCDKRTSSTPTLLSTFVESADAPSTHPMPLPGPPVTPPQLLRRRAPLGAARCPWCFSSRCCPLPLRPPRRQRRGDRWWLRLILPPDVRRRISVRCGRFREPASCARRPPCREKPLGCVPSRAEFASKMQDSERCGLGIADFDKTNPLPAFSAFAAFPAIHDRFHDTGSRSQDRRSCITNNARMLVLVPAFRAILSPISMRSKSEVSSPSLREAPVAVQFHLMTARHRQVPAQA